MGKIYNAFEKWGSSLRKQDLAPGQRKPEFPPPETAPMKDTESKDEFLFDNFNSDLIVALKPHSREAEQFRNLKNSILFPEEGTVPRSIMVTSAAPQDGKSFVAANLAISIAQSIDEYVLLMDCDLRAPSIESLFGFSDTNGLSEYLLSNQPLESLIIGSFLEKLKILTAGHLPKNPSELLSSGQMHDLLAEVTQRYNDRYIILDTPPPYITSESSVLARQVDAIILVVRQRKTLKQNIHDIIDSYGRKKILGIVYNDAEASFGKGYDRYGYHDKYGYYYNAS